MSLNENWYEQGGIGSFEKPRKVNTLIFDPASNRQVAWLDSGVWPSVGSAIELGPPYPDGDAVVLNVRLQLPPGVDFATILVDVNMPEGEGDYVERHPADRIGD
jgi:hypothetical protein